MKILLRCALLVTLVGLSPACRSTSRGVELPCICGTPEADLEGCPHAGCLGGQRNPDNPDCVCGSLSLPH